MNVHACPEAGNFIPPQTSRPLHPTMGQGVAERTYLRRVFTDEQRTKLGGCRVLLNPTDPLFQKWYVAALNSDFAVDVSTDHPVAAEEPETRWETWADVAHRVAIGNVSILKRERPELYLTSAIPEHRAMADAIAEGALLMSGRHLQQGDQNQSNRPMEVFTNCSTAATSFALFQLLLNGSGVGRDYSDQMMAVDWANDMPNVVAVLDADHPDFQWGRHMSRRDAQHLYADAPGVVWHRVADSREGWGKAIEKIEVAAALNVLDDEEAVTTLVIDFSDVRPQGAPIMGMQGRPSSGPAPLMDAIEKIAKVRGSGMAPWRATLYIDHFLAEPVLVGGARRSARMSTKWWQDADILEFVEVKRPVELLGKSREEVESYLADLTAKGLPKPLSFLWSSNNSVTVDEDFWDRVNGPESDDPLTVKAKAVYDRVMACGYSDGTGEPGFINVDRLTSNDEGFDREAYRNGAFLGSLRYQIDDRTRFYLDTLLECFEAMPYHYIVNPCGEIALSILGGFCVIADVVPVHCDSPEHAIEVARIATRALIRVNLLDSLYNAEVRRTNRIGVGVTGIHEAAWKFFRVGFSDLVNPDFEAFVNAVDARDNVNPRVRAAAFWEWSGELSRAVLSEADSYSGVLGVTAPHTVTTVKPSGSVSKLFGLSEGWHLPALRHYLRWVQYHKNSPMIEEYRAMGYPVRELKSYRDHWIVGFPTEPAIVSMGIGDKLVTAGEATMQEQFRWLKLGEFFLMEGGSVGEYLSCEGSLDTFLDIRGYAFGNQISYTMKFRPDDTDFDTFCDVIRCNQPYVRCVSVMPQENGASYEYLPEEQVSVAEYQAILAAIRRDEASASEDVGLEHLDCSTGACPIVFDGKAKQDL
ncbi:hypothetical protein AQY21_20320 [Paracoccus sp. MKU1]|nr:hypothetical protein AQY21_20320 [Paracoccus sp. MKU1]